MCVCNIISQSCVASQRGKEAPRRVSHHVQGLPMLFHHGRFSVRRGRQQAACCALPREAVAKMRGKGGVVQSGMRLARGTACAYEMRHEREARGALIDDVLCPCPCRDHHLPEHARSSHVHPTSDRATCAIICHDVIMQTFAAKQRDTRRCASAIYRFINGAA